MHVECAALVNAGIKILAVAEFFPEKDINGGKSPELAGKARVPGGGCWWRVLVENHFGWLKLVRSLRHGMSQLVGGTILVSIGFEFCRLANRLPGPISTAKIKTDTRGRCWQKCRWLGWVRLCLCSARG